MNESNVFGMSIRGIISFLVVLALCWVCVYQTNDIKVGILKDIAIMVLSYYFGQKTQQTINSSKEDSNVKTTNVNSSTISNAGSSDLTS